MEMIDARINKLQEYLGKRRTDVYPESLVPEGYIVIESNYNPERSELNLYCNIAGKRNPKTAKSLTFKIDNNKYKEKVYKSLYTKALEFAEKEIIKAEQAAAKEAQRIKIENYLKSKIFANSERYLADEDSKPTKHKFDKDFYEKIQHVVYVVEANHFEQGVLCSPNNYTPRLNRDHEVELKTHGFSKTVLGEPTSTMSIGFGEYRGHHILFWSLTSSKCDYNAVEDYINTHLPDLIKNGQKCDAQNFHRCLNYIDDLVTPNTVKYILKEGQ